MVKNHLKRLAVPKTWDVKKKTEVFISRPLPSGHKGEFSVPLIVLFRDMMGRAKTVSEMKYILHNKKILRNGKRMNDHKASVGLMDVISIPDIDKSFRLLINKRGKLVALEIDSKESKLVPKKIQNKNLVKKGAVQINFTDGTNMIVDKDSYKTSDVLIIDIEKIKVVKHLKLDKGALIYLVGGKQIGTNGTLEDIKGNKLLFKTSSKELFETSKEYAFALGKDKLEIKLAD